MNDDQPPPCPPPPQAPPCPPPPQAPAPPAKLSAARLHQLPSGPQSPLCQVSEAVSRWVKFCPEHREENFLCYNIPTVPRLQEGPQCGLVALAMAGHDTDLEEVVMEAKQRGYTKQGEMFSVVRASILSLLAMTSPPLVLAQCAQCNIHYCALCRRTWPRWPLWCCRGQCQW